jgi:hypothetical protein
MQNQIRSPMFRSLQRCPWSRGCRCFLDRPLHSRCRLCLSSPRWTTKRSAGAALHPVLRVHWEESDDKEVPWTMPDRWSSRGKARCNWQHCLGEATTKPCAKMATEARAAGFRT